MDSLDDLVARIARQVEQRLQREAVHPLPAVTGTWYDQTGLRAALADVDRLGTDGSAGSAARVAAPELARHIDHTLLKPDATRADIVRVCEEARTHRFASVCVNSTWIPLVAELLRGSDVMPICVVGFPLGATLTAAKAAEARFAVAAGAREIDMVINVGALKSGDHGLVLDDVRAVVTASQGRPVKVILETSLLTDEEKVAACALAKAGGAAFVKTSTGFGGGGATVADVALMRRVVGPELGVKASGGVRSLEDARALLGAGADRLGASASVAIVSGGASSGSY